MRSDPWDLPNLLRAHPERPRRRRAAEQRDERAALHSITSLAMASKRWRHHFDEKSR
jgi:hypothetical protein